MEVGREVRGIEVEAAGMARYVEAYKERILAMLIDEDVIDATAAAAFVVLVQTNRFNEALEFISRLNNI